MPSAFRGTDPVSGSAELFLQLSHCRTYAGVPRPHLRQHFPHAPAAGSLPAGAQYSRVPAWGVDRVQVLQPRGGEQAIPVTTRLAGDLRGEVTAESYRRLPDSEWLSGKDKRFPTARFELECSVDVPQAASRGRVLLLVQFPGREHRPSKCTAQLNDRPASLLESSSADHIGYYLSANDTYWKGIRPHECEWNWYICDLASGSSRVRFTGAAGHEHPRIGLWAWCEHDLAASKVLQSAKCSEPAMPHYGQDVERRGICLKNPVPVI
jgi:hypothetical protein